MIRNTVLLAIVMSSGFAFAKTTCTDQPKEKWMKEEDFKRKVEADGYKVRKFKQPGTCYEIYGSNSKGQNVEIYFDPVDGKVVKENIE